MSPETWQELLRVTYRRDECGGILIGDRDEQAGVVRVLGFLIPEQHRTSAAFCEFDARWIALMRAAFIRANLDGRIGVVAWIHTHPRLSVFLSGTDVGTISSLQRLNPMMLAVVLDPFVPDAGVFHCGRDRRDTELVVEPVRIEPDLAAGLQAVLDSPVLAGAQMVHVVGRTSAGGAASGTTCSRP